MVNYFHELGDHRKNFLIAAQSAGINTSKSRMTNELQKVGKITEI